MAFGDSVLVGIDTVLNDIFAGWSLSTTIIATFLFFFLAYPWLTWKDPDTHPYLLARQATASSIRQPGESAVYRSLEVPYGYPLRSGLNVKDPGAPKWSSGRNGDLRDIWIQATRGPLKEDGSSAGAKGKIFTVLGREKVVERSLDSVTLEINVIGKYMQDCETKRVAICLSNSVELLASIFGMFSRTPLLHFSYLASCLILWRPSNSHSVRHIDEFSSSVPTRSQARYAHRGSWNIGS
jgi:hypothetical protein